MDFYIHDDQIFSYNFATPAVSRGLTSSDLALTNIYNFNNPGDVVPLLPLDGWGYERYGQTISCPLYSC